MTMSFKVTVKELLKKYIETCQNQQLNKTFDGKPIYGDSDKYIKAKIR